jgi:hypothetical protein
MNNDRYTKVILTVIAFCQCILVIRDVPIIKDALAQSGPVHVIVDQVQSYAFQYAGPIEVRCQSGCK